MSASSSAAILCRWATRWDREDLIAHLAELMRLHDAQPGAHRPLGVVLVRGRHPEDPDHGVADELLDGAAVGLDHLAGGRVVGAQDGVDVLGVGGLAHRREGDEVAEERGDDLALLGCGGGRSQARAAVRSAAAA